MDDDSFMRGIMFRIDFSMGERSFYHINGWAFAQCSRTAPYDEKR